MARVPESDRPVRQAWDLDASEGSYEEFLARNAEWRLVTEEAG